MSTNYHTPPPISAPADAMTFRLPLGQLDQAITNLAGGPDITALDFADATELTIASGAITITQVKHTVDTESDASADDLVTINGGDSSNLLILRCANPARVVTVKHGTGNIVLSGGTDFDLDSVDTWMLLVWDSAESQWSEMTNSGAVGEANTASNVGSAGVGVVKQKNGVDLELKNINAGSSKITVTDDTGDDEIDIDLGTVVLDDLSGVTITSEAQGDFIGRDASGFKNINAAEDTFVGRLTGEDLKGLSPTEAKTLLDILDSDVTGLKYQTILDGGSAMTQRSGFNIIAGSGMTITITDDSGNDRTNATFSATGGGGGGAPEITITAGEDLAQRDHVWRNPADNEWYKFDSDDTSAIGADRAIVTESGGITSSSTGTAQRIGVVSGFTGLTVGVKVWASTTAGGYTQTEPTPSSGGSQVVSALIGIAHTTTSVDLRCDVPVQVLKRDSLTNGSTLTATHPADAGARQRQVRANLSTSGGATLAEEHGTGNQDTLVQLRGQNYAGDSIDTATDLGGSDGLVGANTGVHVWSAQSIQPAGTGFISQFKVEHDSNTGSPTGTMTWRLETDNAGAPSGTLVTGGTNTGTYSPTESATNTIDIEGGPLLSSSTTYHVVFRPTTPQTGTNMWRLKSQSSGSSYAGGTHNRSLNSGSTWSDITVDIDLIITLEARTVYDRIAMSFQLDSGITCEKAQLHLRKVASPTGTLTLRIETDNSGDPSGTLVDANASVTVAESSLGTSLAMVDFDFATNFALSGSTTYWLVLSTDRSASDTNYVEWGAEETGSYADGESGTYSSSSWTTPASIADDMIFGVFAEGTAYEEPANVGSWGLGNAEILARYDDGAGSDADTMTTIKNNSGQTLDVTMVVELGVAS